MLLLTSFTVENFRGIRQGTVSGLTDVNVIIGRNNSGKTTLLEAMHRMVTENKNDILGVSSPVYWNQVRNETDSDFMRLVSASRADIKYGLLRHIQRRDVSVQLGRMCKTFSSWENWQVSTSPGVTVPNDTRNDLVSGATRFGRAAIVYRPPDATNNAIEAKLWPQLLGDRSDKRLAAALSDVFGLQAESFQLLPSGKLIVLFENHSVPLDAQGDGTRAAMRCLMLLTALKQTMFILEEPECHQHPGSLEKFALAVCKLAKQNEVQLMVSTHSGECVKAFLKAAEAANSDGAVFHLSLTDGVQTARRLDAEAVETLQNTGIDVRFLDLYS